MKYRKLRQRLSVSAPRMTVRSHVPPGVTIAVAAIAILLAIAAGVALARTSFARELLGDPSPELGRLVDENHALRGERDRLLEATNTTDSRRAIEHATIKELGDQIARLEGDNARLKEDVAFFEAATADRSPGGKDAGGVAIRRFQITQDKIAHTARFRILLTQDSRAPADFVGTLQLAVTLQQNGKAVNIVLPENGGAITPQPGIPVDADATPGPGKFAVKFKTYRRIDGTFAVPTDATLKSVQVRILERGAVRVQQTVAID
ncbi:MAG: DUF6776 family protein [Burkholderiaceae bacterium]